MSYANVAFWRVSVEINMAPGDAFVKIRSPGLWWQAACHLIGICHPLPQNAQLTWILFLVITFPPSRLSVNFVELQRRNKEE